MGHQPIRQPISALGLCHCRRRKPQNDSTAIRSRSSSQAVEQVFSQLAIKLKAHGIRNFIVAGGETSGVVTQSLQVDSFHIGPQIAPGVPWVKAINQGLSLALKSGNFGDENFFTTAQEYFQ